MCIRDRDTVVVDLSADFRFNEGWYYGLPELTRGGYAGQKRISNPGCYATAMQLAITPLLDRLAGPPQCFGVSGYSGAGTTPSDKNNTELLHDNLMPYALADHMHEREVSRHLGAVSYTHLDVYKRQQQNRFKPEVARKWVELVYEGFYHDPLKTDLEAFLASSQAMVNGEVTLETRGGRVDAVAVTSPHLLHAKGAVYAQSADWGVEEAEGFIKLFGMSSTLWAEINR